MHRRTLLRALSAIAAVPALGLSAPAVASVPETSGDPTVVMRILSDDTMRILGVGLRRVRVAIEAGNYPGFASPGDGRPAFSEVASVFAGYSYYHWREGEGFADPFYMPAGTTVEDVVRAHCVMGPDEGLRLTWLTLEHPSEDGACAVQRHVVVWLPVQVDLLDLPLETHPQVGERQRLPHRVVRTDSPVLEVSSKDEGGSFEIIKTGVDAEGKYLFGLRCDGCRQTIKYGPIPLEETSVHPGWYVAERSWMAAHSRCSL